MTFVINGVRMCSFVGLKFSVALQVNPRFTYTKNEYICERGNPTRE